MPDPVLQMDPVRLTVDPGGQARAVVSVGNAGAVVEGYRVDVVGEAAGWAEVLTPEISVYPRAEAQVVVAFSPPAGAARSGQVPFGVRVVSLVDASATAVVEGDLEVGRVFGLQGKITPVNSSGRWSARHRVELTNWGNAPARLRLAPSDPDEKLGFLVTPEVLDVPLGGTARARLKVRTRSPALRGSAVRLPFRVVAEPDPPLPPSSLPGMPDTRTPVLDGTFTQQPVLARGMVAAAGLLLVGAIGATAYGLTRDDPSGPSSPGGAPPPPVATAASAQTGAVQVVWQPIDRIDEYQVRTLDLTGNASKLDKVDGGLNVALVEGLRPDEQYCFVVRAVREGQPSADSEQACAQAGPEEPATVTTSPSTPATGSTPPETSPGTTPPETTPSTDGGGPPTPGVPLGQPVFDAGQWIAVVKAHPFGDASDPEGEAAQLEPSGDATPGVLDSLYFPGLAYPGRSIVVFVGPFTSADEAQRYCAELQEPCVDPEPKQPGPATAPAPGPSPGPT